jgi:hypothetical protein
VDRRLRMPPRVVLSHVQERRLLNVLSVNSALLTQHVLVLSQAAITVEKTWTMPNRPVPSPASVDLHLSVPRDTAVLDTPHALT